MAEPGHGHIDAHAHYLTARYVEECRAAGHGRPDGMPGLPGWSVQQAIETMDAAGIAAMVLSVSSPGVHFGDGAAAAALARHVNEAGAEIVAGNPDRFGLSAVLPLPDTDAALRELAHAWDELGADAVALETNYHGRYLTSPAVDPVLAELNARGAVVTLHPVSPPCWEQTAFGRPRPMIEFLFDTTRCVVDLVLSGTLARYPRIRWIVPHGGAALPVVAHRVQEMSALLGTRVDVAGTLRTLYFDLAGTAGSNALEILLGITSADRLLYGSDYPFMPAAAAELLSAGLTSQLEASALASVSRGTARDLFPHLSQRISETVLNVRNLS